jgi:hypothetical protein
MVCPSCGVEVKERQHFCADCGASLRGVTEPTELIPVATLPAPVGATTPPLATATAEYVGEPTELIEIDPGEPTQPFEVVAEPSPDPAPVFAPPTPEATATVPSAGAGVATTAEMPALFDGHDDVVTFPTGREPFRVKFIFIAAFLGGVASLMAAVGDVVDIRTTRPASGIATGTSTLDDIGSNLGPAGVVGAAAMVIGGLLACFGIRWAVGLAGGAGLALVGWAALSIGLVEVPVGVAESITRASSDAFTLTVTRDVGWWLIIAVGAIGLIVFLASLRAIRRAGQRFLNPILAAVGAVCGLVLAAGPLVPVGSATWRDNLQSPTADVDLPTIFFAGRLAQVGLIAFVAVVGFLVVRSYGLGLVAGGLSVAAWLWVTSLLEAGPRPVGIADRNPGATDTVPHGVTTVGAVTTVVVLLIAVIVAVVALVTADPE